MAGHAGGQRCHTCWVMNREASSGLPRKIAAGRKKGEEGEELQGVFFLEEGKHPERAKSFGKKEGEVWITWVPGFILSIYNLFFFLFFFSLNSLCGLLDHMLSFTDHVWVMAYLLISPSLLWVVLRAMRFCSEFTMHSRLPIILTPLKLTLSTTHLTPLQTWPPRAHFSCSS